jgi:hypothetical protein
MTTMKLILVMSLTGALVQLTACGANTHQSASAVADVSSSKSVSTDWVVARQKHNNAGIDLRYRLIGKPQIGQPLQVELEFSGATQDGASAQIRMDKALNMLAVSSGKMSKTAVGLDLPLSKAQTTAQTLSVTPQTEGMHYIYFTLGQAGKQSAVSIAVPVGDGPFATPTTGQLQTLPTGEKIIVMPAK